MDAYRSLLIRQSKFCALNGFDDERLQEYLDFVKDILKTNDLTAIGPSTYPMEDQELNLIYQLVKIMVEKEEAIDFIMEQVLPKSIELTREEQSKVRALLAKPHLWDFKYRYVAIQTDSSSATGRHSDDSNCDSPGKLRISISTELSTEGYEGWFEYGDGAGRRNGGRPIKFSNGSTTTHKRIFHPGSIVMWENSSGQHAEPLLTDEVLDSINGSRTLVTFTVSFNRLIRELRKPVLDRLLTKSV